jgi:O-antigen ligase/polysaccharide polymerase Wzy-like membrane protein
MILDSLLAFGLLLSTATQLRFGDTPFGPGEISLAVWLGLVLFLRPSRWALTSNAALRRVAAFWLILIVAESVGTIVGFATEPFFDIAHFIHDLVAYSLMFCVASVMALELVDGPRRRRLTWLVVLFGAASLSLQVAHAFGLIGLPLPVDPWFYDRLRGWSLDPNQLGLVSALLTVMSIYLADTVDTATAGANAKIFAAAACAMIVFSVGVLSGSDSFTVGLSAAVTVFLAIKASLWVATFKQGVTFRATFVCLALLGLPVLTAGALPLAPGVLEKVQIKSEEFYNKDDQGDLRFHLWGEAYVVGMGAAMLGLGPGPHLTKTKSWKLPPPAKFEVHNTPLDLFVQGGLLAVLDLVFLYASLFLATTRARLPALAALSCAFVVFSMFHFVIRHPIFWFGVVLCFLEAASVSKLSFGGRHADVARG